MINQIQCTKILVYIFDGKVYNASRGVQKLHKQGRESLKNVHICSQGEEGGFANVHVAFLRAIFQQSLVSCEI